MAVRSEPGMRFGLNPSVRTRSSTFRTSSAVASTFITMSNGTFLHLGKPDDTRRGAHPQPALFPRVDNAAKGVLDYALRRTTKAARRGFPGHEVQARSSGGERYLDTVEVSGSNPLAPTTPGRPLPGPAECGDRVAARHPHRIEMKG